MNKIRKAFGLVGATIIASAAAATIGAGTSSALTVDEYDIVRQWICSGNGLVIDLDYTNEYGNLVRKSNTRLVGGQLSQDGSVMCIYKDLQAGEYGEYVSTHLAAENGGYVSCATFVNGVKVTEAEDDSDFYSFASCY